MNKFLHILLLSALFICFSCTVSKRHYRKGFYISWTKKNSPPSEKKQLPVQKSAPDASRGLASIEVFTPTKKTILSASAAKTAILNTKSLKVLSDSCGDLITFRDGSEQSVKIIEASDQVIKYKPCNHLDGPIRTTPSENVFMIKYLDGRKRVFREKASVTAVEAADSTPSKKRNNGFAVASFICGMMSFLFLPAIPAVLFGLIGLAQINKNPEKYKGKWIAVTGLIIGGIMSLIFLILISWA
ncbi:MAG: DUF4190 domain-containing protein [Bacteroidia bacterium]|nr:DUF4190 domain-containing protein [Bacteroidia bacterium]